MKLLTLFSGIGAPEQASKRVWKKVKFVAACEIDKFARKSFETIYGIDPAHFHSDINDMKGSTYEGKVDLLVGGSPCQSFSIAGKRKGLDDSRGQLIYQFVRLLGDVQPKVFIYENVKGFYKIDSGDSFEQFCDALQGMGYHLKYKILNTRHYGVPQNRERIFVVGFKKEKHYGRFSFPEPVTIVKKFKDVLEDEVDDKFYLSDKAVKYMNRDTGDGRTNWDKGYHYDESKDYGTAVTANIYKGIPNGVCITTEGLRRLTPKECWRLQDFPDSAIDSCQKAGLSNTQLYKQAGNSMSVNVIEALMRQIKRSMK